MWENGIRIHPCPRPSAAPFHPVVPKRPIKRRGRGGFYDFWAWSGCNSAAKLAFLDLQASYFISWTFFPAHNPRRHHAGPKLRDLRFSHRFARQISPAQNCQDSLTPSTCSVSFVWKPSSVYLYIWSPPKVSENPQICVNFRFYLEYAYFLHLNPF